MGGVIPELWDPRRVFQRTWLILFWKCWYLKCPGDSQVDNQWGWVYLGFKGVLQGFSIGEKTFESCRPFGGASQVVLVIKNLPTNAGDVSDIGSFLGLGRSPGGGLGNLVEYSCLENPMDRGAWQPEVHRVAQSRTRLKRLSTPARPVGGGWYFIYALLTPRITLSMMHLGCPGVWGACCALYVGKCVWFQVLRAPGDSAGPPRRKELHVTSWLRRGGPTELTFPAPGSWSAS